MTEQQRLFVVQARADFEVFELLRGLGRVPACQPLHYLQMATELLGKARSWRHGPNVTSHRAFVGFLRSLSHHRSAQSLMGYKGKNESWEHLIRKSVPLAERIESLAPSLNPDGPNPEYPWPRDDPQIAPVEHEFEIWRELRETADGRRFLRLLRQVFEHAEAFV